MPPSDSRTIFVIAPCLFLRLLLSFLPYPILPSCLPPCFLSILVLYPRCAMLGFPWRGSRPGRKDRKAGGQAVSQSGDDRSNKATRQ